MLTDPSKSISRSAPKLDLTIDFHLLGVVGFHPVRALQQRLVAEAVAGRARSLPILLCEHPPVITVGRSGSRSHIRLTNEQLERRNLSVEWLERGGGCILHIPGQLCIYPIVPLLEIGWSVGEYMRRFHQSLLTTIARMKLTATPRPGRFGVWGQSGLLAACGVRVQDWIAHYGAFLNVAPDLTLFRYVDVEEPEVSSKSKKFQMSSLMAERRGAVKMASVRTALIESLVEVWQPRQFHIHAGHPWLPAETGDPRRRKILTKGEL